VQPRYFLLVDEKLPIATLVGFLAYGSKSNLILFHNLESMIMQNSMMGNCRLALIHIWEHNIYINTWIINIL
jgi:hypothetical protein